MPENHTVLNNKENMRFEIPLEGETAFLEYRFYHRDIAFMHTVVPTGFKGRGVGTALAEYAFAWARENNKRVIVFCPFVAGFLQKRPEFKSLLDPEYYGGRQA